jgi:hypothetical protein
MAPGPQLLGPPEPRPRENLYCTREATADANATSTSSYCFRYLFGERNRPTTSTGPDRPSSTASGTATAAPGTAAAAPGTSAEATSSTTKDDTAVASLVGAIGDAAKMLKSDLSSLGIAVSDAAALECATRIVLRRHQQQREDEDRVGHPSGGIGGGGNNNNNNNAGRM